MLIHSTMFLMVLKKVGDINVDQWEDAISNELLDIVIEKWERVE